MKILQRKIIRSIAISIFVAVNIAVILGISSVYFYFNSGADYKNIILENTKPNRLFDIPVEWYVNKEDEIKLNPVGLSNLKKDYLQNFFSKNNNQKSLDTIELKDFFFKSNYSNLSKYNFEQLKDNINSEQATLTHNPTIHYFSVDGKIVSITDTAVIEYERTYLDKKIITESVTKNNYNLILINENGRWKINSFIKSKSEQIDFFIKSNKNFEFINPIKGVNYYPQNTPWETFEDKFDSTIIETDAKLLQQNQVNTVRIFIPYIEYLDPKNYPLMLEKVKSTLNIFHRHDIKVIITLFDFYSNYSITDWGLCNMYIKQTLQHIGNHPAISIWDIKNEPDLDFKNYPKEAIISWLKNCITHLRSLDTTTPITIGWSNLKDAYELNEYVDIISAHYYLKPEKFSNELKNLESIKKPIIIEEFGLSSYNTFWFPFSNSNQEQETYYKKMFQEFTKNNIKHFCLWTLYDFPKIPDAVVGKLPWRKNTQKHFGLIDLEGNIKPAFQYISGKKIEYPNIKKSSENLFVPFSKIIIILGFILTVTTIIFYLVKIKKIKL